MTATASLAGAAGIGFLREVRGGLAVPASEPVRRLARPPVDPQVSGMPPATPPQPLCRAAPS